MATQAYLDKKRERVERGFPCVCQAGDPVKHLHYTEPPFRCARCGECSGHREPSPEIHVWAGDGTDDLDTITGKILISPEVLAHVIPWTAYQADMAKVRASCEFETAMLRDRVLLLTSLMLRAREHIGNEYGRHWPDDPTFEAFIAEYDAALPCT